MGVITDPSRRAELAARLFARSKGLHERAAASARRAFSLPRAIMPCARQSTTPKARVIPQHVVNREPYHSLKPLDQFLLQRNTERERFS
ncbi:hypothetical protein [Novosphingobium rosa]|uniref:hypothetical protein n=1 Tax=Novosphingobium rosa TaxID=76978 RepID=UPI001471FED9|nr:hypothetical protein [Novosphingobium rosa]